jgi:hypothetical protein
LVNKPPTEFLANRPPPTEAIYNVYELKTQPELIRYYHAPAGFPTKPTWLRAIKNNHYASWTGLTYNGVRKYYPESTKTNKGHRRKLKSGQRSTKNKSGARGDSADPNELIPRSKEVPTIKMEDNGNFKPVNNEASEPQPQERTIFTRIMHLDVDDETNKDLLKLTYTNGTGRFPKTSRRGMNYILVLVEIDSGAILVEAMLDRSAGKQCRAYQVLVNRLHQCKIYPKKHILDNEISDKFREIIKHNKMEHELVPPHDHRRNIAEKGIQKFKDHLIASLCGTDKKHTLLMGRHTTTSKAHAQPPKTITTTAKCVGIRLPLRTAQLQQTTICTTGMQGGGPHDAKHQRHVGRTHCKRVLRGMFTRTLPMPQSIGNKQQGHSSMPNSFFQAQVSNTTIIHQS